MKTQKEILEQTYISASDLTILIPKLTITKARKYIVELQQEMINDNAFVPETRQKLVLTKYAKKKFKF